MKKKSKITLILSISIYLIGLVYGTILTEINIVELIKNLNFEKVMFLSYNCYIIFCFVMLTSKRIQSNNENRKLYFITSIFYIVLQILYLIVRVYKILKMYKLNLDDAKMAIGTYLINPNGFIINIVIMLILFQLYMMHTQDN